MERWSKAVGVQDQVVRAQRLAHELNDGGRKSNQLLIVLGLARELATVIVDASTPVCEHGRTAHRAERGVEL